MNHKSKGIRISDKKKRVVAVDLNEILKEFYRGAAFNWNILILQINGYNGIDPTILDLQEEVEKTDTGQAIQWNDLCALGNDVFQFTDLLLVGSKNPENNKWIHEPEKMYETPDVYIEMFDSSFWEIFSKSLSL